MALMGMGGGLDFDADDNTRDVAWLGDCDEGCLLLAEKLGWGVSNSLFYQCYVLHKNTNQFDLLKNCPTSTLVVCHLPQPCNRNVLIAQV